MSDEGAGISKKAAALLTALAAGGGTGGVMRYQESQDAEARMQLNRLDPVVRYVKNENGYDMYRLPRAFLDDTRAALHDSNTVARTFTTNIGALPPTDDVKLGAIECNGHIIEVTAEKVREGLLADIVRDGVVKPPKDITPKAAVVTETAGKRGR